MPFAIVIIGVVIAIAAWNDSFPALASELEQDIPGYMKWGFAIVALLALGYIPGFRTPSRWLVALIALVYVVTQWSAIQAAFTSLAQSMQGGATASGTGTPTPTASYSSTYAPASATASAGTTSTTSATSATAQASTVVTAAQNLAANPLNPNSYIGAFAGFGGLA